MSSHMEKLFTFPFYNFYSKLAKAIKGLTLYSLAYTNPHSRM